MVRSFSIIFLRFVSPPWCNTRAWTLPRAHLVTSLKTPIIFVSIGILHYIYQWFLFLHFVLYHLIKILYLFHIVNIDLHNTETRSEHRRQFPVEKFLIQKDIEWTTVPEVNNKTLIKYPLGQIKCKSWYTKCSSRSLTWVTATTKVDIKVCVVKGWKRIALESVMVVWDLTDNTGDKRDDEQVQVQNFDSHCADVQR